MPNFRDIYNKNETITDRQWVFTFGKYKGETLETIMDAAPQYILYCQSTIDWFDVSQEILDEIEMTQDEQYFWSQQQQAQD